MSGHRLRTLVVDDEPPIVDEIVYLLSKDDRIDSVETAHSGTDALKILEHSEIDLIFLDIAMPGLTGLDLAKIVARFRTPPKIVFITAHDHHAIDAFDLNAVDYLLKPVSEHRLFESIRRAVDSSNNSSASDDISIPVELGGVTRFVSRSNVTDVEAQGDYVRLHTVEGTNHLIRNSLAQLEHDWSDGGFIRIHRSSLVAARHIREVRNENGRSTVVVSSGSTTRELGVSRRYSKNLKEAIARLSRDR